MISVDSQISFDLPFLFNLSPIFEVFAILTSICSRERNLLFRLFLIYVLNLIFMININTPIISHS